MLSADETIVNGVELRKFCFQRLKEMPFIKNESDAKSSFFKWGTSNEAYVLNIQGNVHFQSNRLSRLDMNWTYTGRVHEVLVPPGFPKSRWKDVEIPRTFIKFSPTDVQRRNQKQFKILEILKEDKVKDPKDERTSFYLARAYKDVGDYESAIEEFEYRVSLEGWVEEVFQSLYAIAQCKQLLNYNWLQIENAYLRAYEYDIQRLDPLYEIMKHYISEKDWNSAMRFGEKLKYPEDPPKTLLFIDPAIYQWKGAFEYAKSAYHAEKLESGARSIVLARVGCLKSTPRTELCKPLNDLYSAYAMNLGDEFPPNIESLPSFTFIAALFILLFIIFSLMFRKDSEDDFSNINNNKKNN
jgi:tetratricopeptide (TPR) repeat protein